MELTGLISAGGGWLCKVFMVSINRNDNLSDFSYKNYSWRYSLYSNVTKIDRSLKKALHCPFIIRNTVVNILKWCLYIYINKNSVFDASFVTLFLLLCLRSSLCFMLKLSYLYYIYYMQMKLMWVFSKGEKQRIVNQLRQVYFNCFRVYIRHYRFCLESKRIE